MTPAIGPTALAKEALLAVPTSMEAAAVSTSHWLQAAFTVPVEAYEMHMAFTNSTDQWDNNGGTNFYYRIKMDMTAEQRSHSVEQAMREGPAWGDVQVRGDGNDPCVSASGESGGGCLSG